MAQRVNPIDLSVTWEPNVPKAVLIAADYGKATLSLNPRMDDPDRRRVVLAWTGVRHASIGGPNDEGRVGHRLYDLGLSEVLWAGEVLDSLLVASLDGVGRNLRHFVVLCKETTVEVVAVAMNAGRLNDVAASDGQPDGHNSSVES